LPEPDSPTAAPAQSAANPLRFLATLAVGFVALFLLLRTLAVEPFGVPTGSMAPTLLGNHREAKCPRCGYPVRVGSPASAAWSEMVCPNCEQRTNMALAPEVNGDRLMVDKNVYSLRRPRRWEVAVFRCPDPKDPLKPYVKRVVGLPGETILIIDGDVYANDRLLRKSLAEVREARLPVFDMAYAPVGGWGSRWVAEPPAAPDATVVQSGAVVLDATASPQTELRATYLHLSLDDQTEHPVSIWNSYDGPPRSLGTPLPAHDFSFECSLDVTAGAGSFTCELFDGLHTVAGVVPVDPAANGRVVLINRAAGELTAAGGVTLRPGKSYRVEFAFVDRRVSLAVDGREVVPACDLPPAGTRGPVTRPLRLAARGCRVVVRDLKIYRDIHYTQYGEHGVTAPTRLGPREYFMLGDNSGNSEDSRKWSRPGVPEADFIGKPVLIHQPLRVGRVTAGGKERVFQTLDWSRLRWLH
jgi:signal peptidase I